ncbi:MAG: anti-sigma regulatory factor, partial [Planctomycetes bacterium]|nr:anti-sigma regulatory factor [Planctomycetota bacterium]
MDQQRLAIKDENDVVAARREARRMAQQIGLGPADQTRLATAVS